MESYLVGFVKLKSRFLFFEKAVNFEVLFLVFAAPLFVILACVRNFRRPVSVIATIIYFLKSKYDTIKIH